MNTFLWKLRELISELQEAQATAMTLTRALERTLVEMAQAMVDVKDLTPTPGRQKNDGEVC